MTLWLINILWQPIYDTVCVHHASPLCAGIPHGYSAVNTGDTGHAIGTCIHSMLHMLHWSLRLFKALLSTDTL